MAKNTAVRTKAITKQALKQSIARNLKQARVNFEPHLTQQGVAELFDPPLTRAAIAQWEIGDTMPDVDRLAILSKTFGCTIDALVFGDDEPKNGKTLELNADAVRLARNWMRLDARRRALVTSLILTIAN